MAQPTIIVITEAQHAAMSSVIEAMGRGPGTFNNVRLQNPALPGVFTHRMAMDMGANETYAAQLRAMAERQDLPPISGQWGENGLITSLAAQTAMLGLQVFTMAGSLDSTQWRDTILAGLGLEIYIEPI